MSTKKIEPVSDRANQTKELEAQRLFHQLGLNGKVSGRPATQEDQLLLNYEVRFTNETTNTLNGQLGRHPK